MLAVLGLGLEPASAAVPAPPAAVGQAALPAYKPPLRGAPGGRVGGASRGTVKIVVPLPTIDALAPDGESGETGSASPTLYFYVSRPVVYPTVFTISAPLRPVPVIETHIASPTRPGIYAIRLADYRVRLEPGIVYTWSVSAVVNPRDPSRDIVASASLLRVPQDPALDSAARAVAPEKRAGLFAQAGLWYDAVAAAAAAAGADGGRALGALMREVGLGEPAALAQAGPSE